MILITDTPWLTKVLCVTRLAGITRVYTGPGRGRVMNFPEDTITESGQVPIITRVQSHYAQWGWDRATT